MIDKSGLTPRQVRELDYHREFATLYQRQTEGLCFDHLTRPTRRWWNGYWSMYARLETLNVKGKCTLVVGCGFGGDAISLARLGAEVYAFDLSLEELQIARRNAAQSQVSVDFRQMPAETLDYPDRSFDLIIIVDILHHCEVDKVVAEIVRVAKPGCQIVINEIYTHSLLARIRRSRLIDKVLYPRMVKFVYKGRDPYITQDERHLTEHDLRRLSMALHVVNVDFYYVFVKRLFPDSLTRLAKLDRLFLRTLRPMGRLLAGRFLMIAEPRRG